MFREFAQNLGLKAKFDSDDVKPYDYQKLLKSAEELPVFPVINRVMRERYAEASKPVFLGGDLNALPDSGTLRALQEAWTVLTPTDGGTYPSHDPKKCIDYILQLDNGVSCETAGARVLHRFEAGDAARASDHLPVLLEIRLPAES